MANAGRPRKLTDAQALEIRTWDKLRNALPTPREIRRAYGISSAQLSLICRGMIYKVPRDG
jgi:hypothetical protein